MSSRSPGATTAISPAMQRRLGRYLNKTGSRETLSDGVAPGAQPTRAITALYAESLGRPVDPGFTRRRVSTTDAVVRLARDDRARSASDLSVHQTSGSRRRTGTHLPLARSSASDALYPVPSQSGVAAIDRNHLLIVVGTRSQQRTRTSRFCTGARTPHTGALAITPTLTALNRSGPFAIRYWLFL